MGNTDSSSSPKSQLSDREREKILNRNLLQQEMIRNQINQGEMVHNQQILNNFRREQNFIPKSKNPLLTNPQLQKEFMRNKRMQEELKKMALKQKKEHIEDDSYDKINGFLSNLQVEEKEDDVNKSHLYMNQGTRYQNIVSSENKPEIGVGNIDREKLIRIIKKQKEEQKEKLKKEHDIRRKEYENKLKVLNENDIDPYKILEVSKKSSMNEIKNAYKRKAKIYHPDRGGNKQQFQIITMAFMTLIEKYKRKIQDKQITSVKDESSQEIEKQNKNPRKNINMKGNNFNVKIFNKIYDENKIYDANDEGYGKWMEENEFDSDETPKIFSSEFNLNVFNNTFEDHKETDSQEIIKYQEPQPISRGKQQYQELGGNAPGDYSNGVQSSMGYTDYRKAHTKTTLINPNSVKIKQYKNVEDLNRERGKKTFLKPEELQVIERNKAMEKQKEEERIMRLNKYDDLALRQFERVNKLFLK